MATVDKYKIQIEVDGEQKIIDVQDEVDNLGRKVTNFAKVGAAAFGALGVSAARMADQIVDMSQAFGISAGKLYQMSVAAEAAGGAFDDVQGIMLRFSNAVDGAVQGNDQLRDSFEKIGISRDQLATLDDQQLFQAVVTGLGNMEDGAQKTALAIDLLGKRAASLNLKEFARLTSGPGDASIDKLFENAADAIGTLEVAFRNLQLAALQTINPILEAIGDFDLTVQDAQKAIQVTGALIAAAFAATTVATIARMVTTITALANAFRTAGASAAFLQALTGPRGIAVVAAATTAAIVAYDQLGNAIDSAANEQERLNDAVRGADGVYRGTVQRTPGATEDPLRDLQLTQSERLAESARRTTEQMRFQNEQANSLRKTINDVANLEQNRARQIIANNQAFADQQNTLFDLEQQIQVEREKGEQTSQAVIAQLEEQKNIVIEQYNETERLNQAEFDRLNTTRLQNEALRDQLSFVNQVFSGMQETQRINDIMLQAAGMSTREREKEVKLNLEELRTIQARSELELQLITAREQGLTDQVTGLQRLLAEEETRHATNMNNIDAEQIAIDQLNNSRVAGVVSAMEQISQQFTPFQMAQDAVLIGFSKMNQAVDDFVKTGKFKFKDFALSAIADITSMLLKAQLFKGITAGLGLFGIKLPGLAMGGPAQAGQPYIVGEKGPELFVPKNAGTVIPNNKLGSQSAGAPMQPQQQVTNNYVTNNINAIDAKSVAQLFVENRKTLLGATVMARKEMPYGMA
jgi:lambda family phage tail tape measure protein